jgi:hypothetical protein
LYRDAGDLEKAEERAAAGVRAAEQVGETYASSAESVGN